MTDADYSGQAAEFIAGVEWYAALGLPVLPEDPAAAAAMRAAGYEVLAEVLELDDPIAVVSVLSEDDDLEHVVSAGDLCSALGVAADELAGREFIATMRETPETGPVLSGFRPVPDAAAGDEMTVTCLLLFGDQAELVPADGLVHDDPARWPAAAIAAETGLQVSQLPGKRFAVRVTEAAGRVAFSGFRLLP